MKILLRVNPATLHRQFYPAHCCPRRLTLSVDRTAFVPQMSLRDSGNLDGAARLATVQPNAVMVENALMMGIA